MLNVSWKEHPGIHRSDSTKAFSQQKQLNQNLLNLVKIQSTRQKLTKSFPENKNTTEKPRSLFLQNTSNRQTTINISMRTTCDSVLSNSAKSVKK